MYGACNDRVAESLAPCRKNSKAIAPFVNHSKNSAASPLAGRIVANATAATRLIVRRSKSTNRAEFILIISPFTIGPVGSLSYYEI